MERILGGIVILGWTLLWGAGGSLLADGLIHLRRSEVAVVGLALGLVIQTWLANLFSQIMGVPLSFWVAAGTVLIAGIVVGRRLGTLRVPKLQPGIWLPLLGLFLLFNAIGQGLGVFDDYQNLPTVSLIATGDIPPHFALDPSLQFGYHYLLLLFAAELMRLGNMLPWSALDLGRAVVLALPLALTSIWVYRITRKRLHALLGAAVVAFAGGSRWLLLLLPVAWVQRISDQITLIGSAASSASSLSDAMVSSWKIDGAGPVPFPFAFHSGVNPAYIMGYTGIAGSGVLIVLLLLLTSQRWRNAGAIVITSILLSALALANEILFLLLGMGLLIAAAAWLVRGRKGGDGRRLLAWLGATAAALVAAVLQGGMLTEIVRGSLEHNAAAPSYFDPTPHFVWPPTVVSAHLGALSMAVPGQLIAALLEIGPIVLVTPLVLAWGWRSLRGGNWFEASLVASSFGVLIAVVVRFDGPLYTAVPRLMTGWFLVSALYFIPLAWAWSRRRSSSARVAAASVGILGCFAGFMLFGVQLAAIQRPIYASFISALDAKMADEHWNELSPGSLIFDPVVFRAPTVFGRATKSSPTWYTRTAEWESLRSSADPFRLRAAGFDYLYIDSDYWEQLNESQKAALGADCVIPVWQIEGIHSEKDYTKDFRRLLDIRGCR